MILRPVTDTDEFSGLSEKAIGVFGSSRWLSLYGDTINLVGIYDNGNKLIGGFFYATTRKFGLKFVKLPPYSPHCGLFFNSETSNSSSRNSFTKEIMSAVCEKTGQLGGGVTVLAFPPEIKDLQPFIWNGYKVVPNYTYMIDLRRTVDEITSDFDPKNRNVIAKAQKQDFSISVGDMPADILYNFFSEHLGNSGANVYHRELEGIFKKFADESNSFTVSASKHGKIEGMVFCAFDSRSCYYLFGAVKRGKDNAGLNNLLVFESIKKARELGCAIFDFEGSMLKGVEKFFRSFGPKLVPYYTVNKAWLPLEMLLKFRRRSIF